MRPQKLQASPTREADVADAPLQEQERVVVEEIESGEPGDVGSNYRVILYNDDFHGMDEVVEQLVKATGYPVEQCIYITFEAHHQGRAVCYRGTRAKCQRVTGILREIRLQCEVDCD